MERTDGEILLEMNHVKKSFDGTGVLQDISLTVKKGEVVSIIGPSGSGKSTLLRCATLLEKMDGGELIYLGQTAASEKTDKNGRKGENNRYRGEYGKNSRRLHDRFDDLEFSCPAYPRFTAKGLYRGMRLLRNGRFFLQAPK